MLEVISRSGLISFFCCLLLLGCQSEQKANDSNLRVESFPSVDLNDYDTILHEEISFMIPHDLSLTNGSLEGSILAYNNLVDERNFEISEFEKGSVRHSFDQREKKVADDSLFLFFAEEYWESFQGRFEDVELQDSYCSLVSGAFSCYYHFYAKQPGYPHRKAVSLRLIDCGKSYYALLFWSREKDTEKYVEEEDVMMLSFKTNKKG